MRCFEEMRPPPDWMMKADLYILDLLDQVDLALSPPVLAFELDYHGDYMSKRCRVLTEAGLLESAREEKRGLYRITDFGQRYLNEELSNEERSSLVEFGE
jgi:repressor of nif and glnA expression